MLVVVIVQRRLIRISADLANSFCELVKVINQLSTLRAGAFGFEHGDTPVFGVDYIRLPTRWNGQR